MALGAQANELAEILASAVFGSELVTPAHAVLGNDKFRSARATAWPNDVESPPTIPVGGKLVGCVPPGLADGVAGKCSKVGTSFSATEHGDGI